MNLFLEYQKKISDNLKKLRDQKKINLPYDLSNLVVELPPKGFEADISCNAAMIFAKVNKKNPFDLATIIKKFLIKDFNEFEKIDVIKPGFLNISFKMNFWKTHLFKIIKSGSRYGSTQNIKRKYNIEFVSANPTGPLHIGHCRGAILGDVLSNLIKFNGHSTTKEYYVNDYGEQIKKFIMSIYYRIIEIQEKKKFPIDKNLYPGTYIIDIAKKIISQNNIKKFNNFEKIYEKLKIDSLKISLDIIRKDLDMLGIKHDNFVYESNLIDNDLVSKTVKKLQKNNFVYLGKLKLPKGEAPKNWKERDQLLFNSTMFGDDTDRALQKADKSWTYFAGDIAYHAHKIDRNFDILLNILGADHAGYIKRITAAVQALSKNKINLVCKVSQLVKLFKEGKPFKMSKRKGDYITVKDLINEVGKDSVRFMMLSRSNDVELDFDFTKVAEKSKDNPVFYVQYAYARINSVYKTLNLNIDDGIKFVDKDFILNRHEIEILKKISEWPKCLEISFLKFEPHRIVYYLYDLVTFFHAYWNLGKDNKDYRFILENKKFQPSRLILLKALSIVIKNGMSILGVSTPKTM